VGTRRRGRTAAREAGSAPRAGALYVVGTPIGNLDDLSARAVSALHACALIACEDTRVTRGLLRRHGLDVPLLSCHRHNESRRLRRILELLGAGSSVAIVCDGGTPGLSDPGALVVRAARASGHRVIPIPGPSALTALWSVSGFPPGPFLFVGFLPRRPGERRRALGRLEPETRPLVFFESPHRILGLLEDARAVLGDRQAFLGREMTKMHEEFLGGSLDELRAVLAVRSRRGEFSLLVEGAGRPPAAAGDTVGAAPGAPGSAAAEVARLVEAGLARGRALRQVARRRGLARRDLYREMLREREAERAEGGARGGGAPAEEE
jgi:16S rRNA (cytidine1402-2'-O)-methyltransferase